MRCGFRRAASCGRTAPSGAGPRRKGRASGLRPDAAVVVGAPAKFVSDPNFDFAANEATLGPELARQMQGQRDGLLQAVAELLAHFGAHSRNAVRGMRAQTATATR